MRLIGTIEHQSSGKIFSDFLNQHKIGHQLEIVPNQDWGSLNYGANECRIWIEDEDQVVEAKKWLDFFLNHPEDPIFSSQPDNFDLLIPHIPLEPATEKSLDSPLTDEKEITPQTPWSKQPIGLITRSLLLICSLLLILSQLLTPTNDANLNTKQFAVFISPVHKALLYDYPYYYELVEQYLDLYGGEKDPQNLPPEAQTLLAKINDTPFWQGIYSFLSAKKEESQASHLSSIPLFEKIRQGQVWRLFTPALLHADIFHLFFNMLWLIVLGKQIEQHLTRFRYIFLLLLLGVFSNTLQYFASGSNFVGFSGVLCGMLTFIGERQKKAPWEGYELTRLTYLFMMIFILGMAFIQFFSFFMEKSFNMAFSPNVANVAHLSGALLGYLLGKTNIFSWRHS